jgi:taurine---2-oxoglutarate transaminase
VGDVRSIGLFSVIEMVSDPHQPGAYGCGCDGCHQRRLFADGLTTFINKNMLFVCPPLVINEMELLDGLEIIERAIAAAAAT